jgi:hypothetical protein
LYNSLAGSVSDEKINATVAVGDDWSSRDFYIKNAF